MKMVFTLHSLHYDKLYETEHPAHEFMLQIKVHKQDKP